MNDRLDRVRLLIYRGRFTEAQEILTSVVADAPDSGGAHALRALCFMGAGEPADAHDAAKTAVGLDPDQSFPHYVLAHVLRSSSRHAAALEPARAAVRLDPDDPDTHSLEAACLADAQRWDDVLDCVERALALDPTHSEALNLRAVALRSTGRTDEAREALRVALEDDPDHALTHANVGWTELKDGDPNEAIRHFREALRLDPSDEYARQGLIYALRARYPLYRPVLWWQMLGHRLTTGKLVWLVLAIFVGVQLIARSDAGDTGIGRSVMIGYIAFVWLAWSANALFDVLLFMRKDLRPLLHPREQVAACGVLACIVLGLVVLAVFSPLLGLGPAGLGCMAFLFAAIPMSTVDATVSATMRVVAWVFVVAAILPALAGAALFAYAAFTGNVPASGGVVLIALNLFNASVLAAVISTWVLAGTGIAASRGK